MKKCKPYELPNGLKILYQKRDTDSVSIQLTVKVGSNKEENANRGISHFLEHIVFEGTKTRNAETIAREIEGIGGEIGAYTSNERTCFYVNCLKKDFRKAAEILSDILFNPSFKEDMIEKERGVILSEIRMREDEPRLHQWSLFVKALYKNHPAKHPVIGYRSVIRRITKRDLTTFHSRYYKPNNMILTVTGGDFSLGEIKRIFSKIKRGKSRTITSIKEPLKTIRKSRYLKREISQSYTVVGCKTVPRENEDSYAIDIIQAILGKGLSGRLFTEIRTKRGLAYDVGVHHETKYDYGFFAFYVSTEKEKLNLCKKLFRQELDSDFTEIELGEAKNFIEGNFIRNHEDNHHLADSLGEWASRDRLDEFYDYVKKIRQITLSDLSRVREKYFKEFVTVTIYEKRGSSL